jgi:hypothetical protein
MIADPACTVGLFDGGSSVKKVAVTDGPRARPAFAEDHLVAAAPCPGDPLAVVPRDPLTDQCDRQQREEHDAAERHGNERLGEKV